MMGKPNQLEPKLFYHGVSLDRRIPRNHPLRKIEQHINFNFIRSQVADLYGTRGQQSVDPAVILKLMFLLFYENIKSERALMQQLPLRLDWLWFCGYDLDVAGDWVCSPNSLKISCFNALKRALSMAKRFILIRV